MFTENPLSLTINADKIATTESVKKKYCGFVIIFCN